jgi:hypothetical protein
MRQTDNISLGDNMKVLIYGSSKSVDRKRTNRALKFYASLLMTKRLVNKLTIVVKYKNMAGNIAATCTWTDDNRRPKEFEIEVDKSMGVRRTLMVLAHEMVHVKQFAKSEMVDYLKTPDVSFKGVIYNDPHSCEESYWENPWEIEAYGRELGLYHLFMKKDKKTKKIG